jgi:DNA polymerase
MENQIVPNCFPTVETSYRLAIIGEAPGAEEVVARTPFVGAAGRLLSALLSRCGIMRSACFVGNICQHRPMNNDISTFEWGGEEIQSGLERLKADLETFRPTCILLLGATALRAFTGEHRSIEDWRGSVFAAAEISPGTKCIASYRPADCLRMSELTPLLNFDLRRARSDADFPDLRLPERSFELSLSADEIIARLDAIEPNTLVSFDIEGGLDSLSCLSISTDPGSGFIIPFEASVGTSKWDIDTEVRIWAAVKKLMERSDVPKVLQNSLYDCFVLGYSYGIHVSNVAEDTMLKHWELYCELPKSLGLQASLYTREPYYKSERKADTLQRFWTYCCKDSAITLEICQKLDGALTAPAKSHYRFNVNMLRPLLYTELRGISYDEAAASDLREKTKREMYLLQHRLNKHAGCELSVQSETEVLALFKEIGCQKRLKDACTTVMLMPQCALKPYIYAARRLQVLCQSGFPFDDARNGEAAVLLNHHLNVDSNKQMCDFLYRKLALPVQYKPRTTSPTADVLAMLRLYKKTDNPICKLVLQVRALATAMETLAIKADEDHRVRCGYNVVGTVTGRLTCYKSPTGSGYNLQTVTKKQRHLFKADPDMWMFQCDLSGADGWTVAAHCQRLGDPTMMDDYLFGLKPANIIALMYEGMKVNGMSREQLKVEGKKVDKDGWLYFACKRVQHGSNYGMGKITMSDVILKDSYKYLGEPTVVPSSTCEQLQRLYYMRYPGVLAWHRWMVQQLKATRSLTSGSGHTHHFFGRSDDHDTLKSALADEPQQNTTYATNRAILNLWLDPENRSGSRLIVEPLHQVHDALIGQFPKKRTDWAVEKIRGWFNEPLTIAGQSLVIPFEGNYGDSWGNLNVGTI